MIAGSTGATTGGIEEVLTIAKACAAAAAAGRSAMSNGRETGNCGEDFEYSFDYLARNRARNTVTERNYTHILHILKIY